MKLEGSNVFRGSTVERFSDEVIEVANVIGVSINGGLGHVADLQVFGEPLSDVARAFFVRRHGVVFLS